MSTAELATMYGVPGGTIKSRLFHARRLLAALMPQGAQMLPDR
jgi:DNA-directed RNA polymerase specialized sigma24 family protein